MRAVRIPNTSTPNPPGGLGRHIEHDPRSRRYEFPTSGITVTPVRWTRHGDVFDQGNLGSCTGNAAAGVLLADPVFATLPTGLHVDEAYAVDVYSQATGLDAFPGSYPPQDTGSTGIAAAKALQARGVIAGYLHTFTFPDFLKALSTTPVMVGLNWYSSFDTPDSRGRVKIASSAVVRGGHEVYADEITADGYIGFTNSWSSQWGLAGRFYASQATVERLLSEDGDVVAPVPASAPVPVPTPAPAPTPAATPDDLQLWAAMRAWARTKGLAGVA